MPTQNTENDTNNIPSWITKEFLENCLKKTLNNNQIYLESVDWNKGKISSKGENYCSVIFLILLRYRPKITSEEVKELNLLIKIPPVGDFGNFVTGTGFFKREIEMYTKTLPKLELYRPKGENNKLTQWNAICYFADYSPMPTLILENLAISGFKLANRLEGLNEETALFALTALSRFHAASHKVSLIDPKVFQVYDENPFCSESQRGFMTCLAKGSIRALVFEMNEWPEKKWRKISERLTELSDGIIEIGQKASLRDNNSFNVMNHGDFWVNNFMFMYDENNKAIDIRFVDYQLGHYSSPVLDLHYFLNTSLSEEARRDGNEKYIKCYYNSLISAMESLNLKGPTYDELINDFYQRIGYSLFVSICLVPLIICPGEQSTDLNEWIKINGEITEKVPAFANPKYQRIITGILDEFVRREVI